MRVIPSKVSVGICLSIGVFAPSCGSDIDRSEADLKLSGVGILAEGCSLVAQLASGVVVDLPGQVVTVAHAIAGATSISVVDYEGEVHLATVRAFDKDSDLAVLDVTGLDAPALAVAPSKVGAGFMMTWNRDAGVMFNEIVVSKQLTVTIEDIYVKEVVERRGIEVFGEVQPGDSGGGVLSPAGDVIGIIYAQSRVRDGVGFATDSSELRALLRTTANTPVANGHCG